MNKNVFPESREELISMFIGLGIVIVLVVIIFNFVIRAKGNISLPGISTKVEQNVLTKPGDTKSIGDNLAYEVKVGDSLWNIAVAKYGDGFLWTKIASENNIKNPSVIEVGQKLVVPTLTQVEKTTITKDQAIVAETYQVLRGDSLWTIAVAKYGDGYKWVQIWNLNKDKIADSNRLEVGMVLKLR